MLTKDFLSDSDLLFDRMEDILRHLKKAGADEAELSIGEATAFDVQCRHGDIIDNNHAESRDLAVRVFIGRRKADIGISLDGLEDIEPLADRVIAMAKASPEDIYCGLAENTVALDDIQDIEVYDAAPPDMDRLKANALEAEEIACAQKGITNSEGSNAGWLLAQSLHMTSLGFRGVEIKTRHHLSSVVLAERDGKMERDYEYYAAHFAEDMPSPMEIGKEAARRTLARLGAVKPKSCAASVVYHPRVARSLLGHFAAAISGAAIARGTSFLKDKMGQRIFPEAIEIMDDPFRRRGLRSQAFDGEGVAGEKRRLIADGRLESWLLDWPSARQLGLHSTAHASGGSPSPTNLWVAPSDLSPEALIGDMDAGLYVTELIGSGANLVTGDYSRGCAGFWIEQGRITHPVHEITIVGNLKEMFATLSVANDLRFRYGVDAPTIRIERMTIAGA